MSTIAHELIVAAQAARILSISRARVLELARSASDFPPAESTPTGGRLWPRTAIETWGAAHPDRGPLHSSPTIPQVGERSAQVSKVESLATGEAEALQHTWIGQDHLALALLHHDCPGAAREVLGSFGVAATPLREALVASFGDPYEPKESWRAVVPPLTQLLLERANLEAMLLADAEVTSEHVLLALTRRWDDTFATAWLQRCGIDATTMRQRVVDITEGVTFPEPPPLVAPTRPDPAAHLDLAPNPNGRDPRRRRPWSSMSFDVSDDRPFRVNMLALQYFVDRDGYPVLTTDGRPVHILVDEQGMLVPDEQGRGMLGPVDVPPGAQVIGWH